MQKTLLITTAIVVITLFFSGCATNPITGRSQVMAVSDTDAARESAQAYSQLVASAAQQNALDDPSSAGRVRQIAHALVDQAISLRPESREWQWDVHVLNSDEVNAWCMAGGKIAVYTGLLNKIQPTDDELAQVLGHEIAHALLSHQAEKMSRAKLQKAGVGLGVVAGAVMGYDLRSVAGLADKVATVGLQLPNNRQAESEADLVGIELAAKAGYNPQSAVTLWQKMIEAGGSHGPEWLSTHPNPQSRIANIQQRAQELMPVYLAARR